MDESNPTSSPLAVSPKEAARIIGCSEAFLRKKARAYEIPHSRFGKSAIKFTQDDIADTLAILRRPVQAPRRRAA